MLGLNASLRNGGKGMTVRSKSLTLGVVFLLASFFQLDLLFGAEITDITSVGGSTFTAVTEDAEIISENHSTKHRAELSAIKYLQENCKEPKCYAYVDQNFRIRFEAKGTVPESPPEQVDGTEETKSSSVIVSWNPPVKRADGTDLKTDEIKQYHIIVKQDLETITLEPIGHVYEYQFERDPQFEYRVQIATEDVNGLKGLYSFPVIIPKE
jgi:hypothetical protein